MSCSYRTHAAKKAANEEYRKRTLKEVDETTSLYKLTSEAKSKLNKKIQLVFSAWEDSGMSESHDEISIKISAIVGNAVEEACNLPPDELFKLCLKDLERTLRMLGMREPGIREKIDKAKKLFCEKMKPDGKERGPHKVIAGILDEIMM